MVAPAPLKVVVVGAGGFLGAHCVAALRARGHQAVGFVRRLPASERALEILGSAPLIEIALQDAAALSAVLRSIGPDVVVNAAGYAKPRVYLRDFERNFESLQAGLTVLEAVRRAAVHRLVLLGSCLEGLDTGPESAYAHAKRQLHDRSMTPDSRGRTSVVCAHVFSPYGPYENPERVVPAVIQALLRDEPIALGPAAAQRDYIHVADVATAVVALAETTVTGAIDVCTGRSVPLRDVFTTIGRVVGRPELLRWNEARINEGESFDVSGDPACLRALGWRPQFDLDGGIRDTVTWWRARVPASRGAA